jgi:hypothetical protein
MGTPMSVISRGRLAPCLGVVALDLDDRYRDWEMGLTVAIAIAPAFATLGSIQQSKRAPRQYRKGCPIYSEQKIRLQ